MAESLIKLSSSWSLSEVSEVGPLVTLPSVVFWDGPADPGEIVGAGFVFATVGDTGAGEPPGGARLRKRLLSPISRQHSWRET